jgi:hypothetical protein
MSCDLLYKDYWLEYENGTSSSSKIYYTVMIIAGLLLFLFGILLERDTSCSNPSSNLKNLFRALQLVSVVLVLIPSLILIFSSSQKTWSSKYVMFGTIILCALALTAVVLVASITIEFDKCGGTSDVTKYIWAPTATLAFATFAYAFYRYKTASRINIPKQSIDWKNLLNNRRLIEKIASKQFTRCGQLDEEGKALKAFIYYMKSVDQNFRSNTNMFSRAFRSAPQLPRNKLPNIARMVAEYEQDVGALQSAVSRRARPQTVGAGVRGAGVRGAGVRGAGVDVGVGGTGVDGTGVDGTQSYMNQVYSNVIGGLYGIGVGGIGAGGTGEGVDVGGTGEGGTGEGGTGVDVGGTGVDVGGIGVGDVGDDGTQSYMSQAYSIGANVIGGAASIGSSVIGGAASIGANVIGGAASYFR